MRRYIALRASGEIGPIETFGLAPWPVTGYEYRPDIDRKTKTTPMPKDQTATPPTPECLDQILRCVEWRGRPGDEVTFTGADPILPTVEATHARSNALTPRFMSAACVRKGSSRSKRAEASSE